MPGIARKKIKEIYDHKVDFSDIFIIGDTIYDIECAKKSGAVAIAVGTGWVNREVLINHNPDFYFDDLSDIKSLMNIISAEKKP